jgi:molybdenum cofactor guanylyltransferase
MKNHQKHSKLNKPNIGLFSNKEIAILGTKCSVIHDFVSKISTELSQYKIAYLDAAHDRSIELPFRKIQDQIGHFEINSARNSEIFKKSIAREFDLLWVNGNHFEAKNQIIIIDPEKENSLKKRASQLTDIKAIIVEEKNQIFEWLTYGNDVKLIKPNDYINLRKVIEEIVSVKPSLKALILAGGESSRMGTDKSQIEYHGKSQKMYLKEVFSNLNIDAYTSVKKLSSGDHEIADSFVGLGPYGGILSAFKEDPNAAWLVVACDLPFVNENYISELIKHRNISTIATAFYNAETQLPDPLFTIWEPRAYPVLLEYLAYGYSCPRKVLINESIELIQLSNQMILTNVNTPEEKEEAIRILNK